MADTKDSAENVSLMREALKELRKARKKIAAFEQAQVEPIAIIGIGCRFPGGVSSPAAFWRLLENGMDAVTETPVSRWDNNYYYDPDPDAPGKISTRYGAFIEQVDKFDAGFFGVSPHETKAMDPQQRLLLETSWEALENAGIEMGSIYKSNTGVFIGISNVDYLISQAINNEPGLINAYAGTGNALSASAGRISYLFGFQGPSLAIDTACSSSLVTLHNACESLKRGECNLALAGGVNLLLTPETSINFSKARMMSSDGRCKTFDATANGYVRGEGCGILVLKRLSDAKADGDTILSLIRASAVNQDGPSSGFTVPHGPSQSSVIQAALNNAKVDSSAIQYVEAHGTGTSLGDPIEIGALDKVFGDSHTKAQPLLVGAVKTNIGHLEAASGIAGVIKAALSLQNKKIPASLHFSNPNPHISWDEIPIKVTSEQEPWPECEGPRMAGVSSFGFSGTNAHVILEEAPSISQEELPKEPDRPVHILPLSAKSPEALKSLVQRYQVLLSKQTAPALKDLCYSAATGRSHFRHRIAIVSRSMDELEGKLQTDWDDSLSSGVYRDEVLNTDRQKLAFLFTGQGSQYVDMGQELFESHPAFRATLEQCDEILQPYLEYSLLEVLYPSNSKGSLLDETGYTQPALFALEYALATLWQSWGIQPSVVMGHSVGEYVAACIAGVFSLEDGLKLIAIRGQLMQALPEEGGMVAILTDEERVITILEAYSDQLSIAAINGLKQIVVSGANDALEKVCLEFKAEGVAVKPLSVSHAFHSPLMQPILEDFARAAGEVTYSKPEIRIISNVSGELIGEEICTADYWVKHVSAPVCFSQGIASLHEQECCAHIEIGPKPALLTMGQQCIPESKARWLPSLREGQSDWQQLLNSIGDLYVGGVTFDWDRFDANYSRRSVTLPTYPFQRKRYWFETKKKVNVGSLSESISTKELGLAREGSETGLYELQWETKSRASLTLIKPGEVGSWLIFADQSNLGEEIAKLLVEQGECCNLIFPNNNKASNSESSSRQIIDPANPQDYIELLRCHSNNQYPLKGVIYLWPLDLNVTSLDAPLKETYLLGCGSVLNLIQAMAKVKGKGKNQPHLWLTTRGTQEVYDNVETTVLNVQQSSLWGLGRVIGLELPELKCVRMDLDFQPSEDEALVICTELLHSDKEDQIVWRNRQNQRYVARLRYVQHSAKEDLPQQLLGTESCPQIKKQRSYLITGGLGTLGLRAAEWLIAQGARHLVLVGRSGSSLQAKKAIAQIKKAGVHIETKKLDISDFKACNKLLNDFGSKFPALGGLIHAAGVLEDGILMQQDWSQFETVMKPKILGAWNLHQLTTGQALDFFWCFSSISSVLGSPGQGNYAAANAFMDTLMHHRHQSGLSGLSINWGPWDQTSMVSDIGSTGKIQMAARGIQLLALNQGEDLFNQLLITESAQVMVANIDWSLLRQNLPVQLQSLPMFLALDNSSLEEVNSSSYSLLTVGKDGLINYLRDTMAKVLGYEPLSVDVNSSLIELGIDSLMALSLRSNVIQNTGVEIPIDILVARPTNIKSIATFLLDEMAANSGTSQDDSALPDIIPIPEGQEIPLSFAQQRLWFIDQLMGGESTVYNMPIVLRLQGKANVDALGQALADLVKRHDSLRMTFVSKGEIEEVELLSAYEPLELDDISAIAEEEQEALVRSKTEDYLGQSFKLDQGPLFKARLLVLGEEEHVLLANMHHIISDGWSMGVLIRDFVSLYQSRDTGLASTLTPLAIQYQDYAYWQRQWLSGDVLQKQLDYWKGKLTGAPELLELPTDRARPAQQSYRGAQVSSHLPKSMLDALNQLGKEQGTTLFMTLLAAFNVLLNRYSHQDDICVGSPIANRNHPGTEDQVGFFVNTLVLRSQFEGIETFEDLLQQTKKTCLEAYAHQDVPFEQLVEELQPTRNAAINPLFQVMFALQNAPMDDIELPELRLAFVENESLISRFDLTIEVTETEAGLYLRWEYNSDLFDAWRIEKMGEHFALLLEGIAQDSEQVLVLPLLTESEQQSLVKWNDTAVDYPKDQTIIDLFRSRPGSIRITPPWCLRRHS